VRREETQFLRNTIDLRKRQHRVQAYAGEEECADADSRVDERPEQSLSLSRCGRPQGLNV
jgi:hypothetical protein